MWDRALCSATVRLLVDACGDSVESYMKHIEEANFVLAVLLLGQQHCQDKLPVRLA